MAELFFNKFFLLQSHKMAGITNLATNINHVLVKVPLMDPQIQINWVKM